MLKIFLLASVVCSLVSLIVTFIQFCNADDATLPSYYERILLEFGFFFNGLLILVISLLFGWI